VFVRAITDVAGRAEAAGTPGIGYDAADTLGVTRRGGSEKHPSNLIRLIPA